MIASIESDNHISMSPDERVRDFNGESTEEEVHEKKDYLENVEDYVQRLQKRHGDALDVLREVAAYGDQHLADLAREILESEKESLPNDDATSGRLH